MDGETADFVDSAKRDEFVPVGGVDCGDGGGVRAGGGGGVGPEGEGRVGGGGVRLVAFDHGLADAHADV